MKPNFEQTIPNLAGKSLIAVEVEYPPGAGSLPHMHAKSAFIYAYMVSGAVESKVNDGDVHVYRAGEKLVRTARREPSRKPEREQNPP